MGVVVCGVVYGLAMAAVAAARNRLGVGGSFREAVIAAAALCGGFVVAITEGLGAVGELRFAPVMACWALAAAGLAGFLFLNRKTLAGWWHRTTPLSWCDRGLIAITAVVVGASGLIAVVCPPNNADVTLYHLPRQEQWLQQASVDHFPTQDYRLTVNPPFAEFVGLHLMLLSGTDRLAPVESWAAMLLTLAAVSLVARELGLSRIGQLTAALFAVTVPVGFHEAANGKNDWLVAFWLATSVFWALRVWKAEYVRAGEAVSAGLSVGLLVLTKGTGAVYALPVVLLGGVGLALRRPAGWLPAVPIVGVLTLFPNLGHWSRNLAAYGSVSGKTFGLDNEQQTPAVWASGVVRNVGMHLASPRAAWNWKVEKYIRRVHGWLGLGTADPRTTWLGIPFKVEYQPHREDFATAPVHTLLLLAAIPALAVVVRGDRLWWVYLLATTGGFLTFCVVFKWQPWHPRLHLPAFALGGVGVGWLLTRPGVRWVAPVAVAGLVLSVVPAATRSESRSLGPDGLCILASDPDRLRFYNQDTILAAARELVSRVQALRPRAIDLVNQEPASWEYPITLWLRAGDDPPWVGYFYSVPGSSTAHPPADVVIDVGSPHPPDLIRHPQTRRVYRLAERVGRFSIYQPMPAGGEYAGYRLTASGSWEAIPGRAAGDPPRCDHPAARFGIGPDPPADP